MVLPDAQAFADFDSAAREVLAFLAQRIGFDLWLVTRTEGADWIVLKSQDQHYGVVEGSVFRWEDTFCSHMIVGNGPRIAPDTQTVPAYATAPIGKQFTIGAYVGIPLLQTDGSLFGTLCAIHPIAQPEAITAELPLIELMAKLLSTVLNADLRALEQTRYAEQAQAEAWSDGLTELYNRRGWDHLVGKEETRCQQYGCPACVVAIDLDGLKQLNDSQGHAKGDELIRRAGQAIRQSVRRQDVVARVGGDEFTVLCIDCNFESGKALLGRIREALTASQIEASLGLAVRFPSEGLQRAWENADQAMYVCKQDRKACSSPVMLCDHHTSHY